MMDLVRLILLLIHAGVAGTYCTHFNVDLDVSMCKKYKFIHFDRCDSWKTMVIMFRLMIVIPCISHRLCYKLRVVFKYSCYKKEHGKV